MVRLLSLLLMLLPFCLFADVKVSAEVDNNTAYTGSPVAGTLSVTYPNDEEIDEESFSLKEEPLQVERAHTVAVSSTLKIAYYKFTLPPQEKGLHMLPSVSVNVEGKRYRSIPATYEVKTGQAPEATQPVKQAAAPTPQRIGPREKLTSEKPTLELNGQIEAPTPFYPGERARFFYEITFSQNIALSKEDLPLLQAEGMSKIGEPNAETYLREGKTVQRITQWVKAEKPGQFTYGPSTIEGQAYKLDESGKKIATGPVLTARFAPLELTVSPFPAKDKPPYFDGAIGNFQLSVKLNTSPKVTVGDTMTLTAAIKGEGEMDTIKMPDLSCQPGWSGLFGLNNLPPTVNVTDKTKTFTFDIRPKTTQVKQIPPIAFSFFNPDKGGYDTSKSDPIAIEVAPAPKKEEVEVKNELPEQPETIEISGNYPLSETDLTPSFFSTAKALWLIPLGIALLLLQIALKKRAAEQPAARSSDTLFQEGVKNAKSTAQLYQSLQKAFLERLVELGEIASPSQDLPDSGYAKEVKHFFQHTEEMLYTPNRALSLDTLLEEAKDLFKRMKR